MVSRANLYLRSTSAQVGTYLHSNYVPSSPAGATDPLLTYYPDDITQGSPFDTGLLNVLSPQFKRLAAIVGDLVFQAPRRFFLEQRSGKQSTWAFRASFPLLYAWFADLF